jgi:hypothetical protein
MAVARSPLEKALGIEPCATFAEIGRALGVSYQVAQFTYYRAWYRVLKTLEAEGHPVAELIALIPQNYRRRFDGAAARPRH